MRKNNEITGKPTVLKELNTGLIKAALGECGQATRVEIAKLTGISQPTVNLLMKELVENDTVLNLGPAPSTGGRRAEVYALNQKKSEIVLVAVKGGFFEIAVVDMELHEEQYDKVERKKGTTCNEQLVHILEQLTRENRNIGAVSIGVQGAVTNQGEVFAVPTVPEWENYPLQSILMQRLMLPVRVTNDINASAAGFQSLHPQMENMIYLYTDGEGIGAGIILNKEVYSGSGSFAGELGYMLLGGRSVEELMHDKRMETEQEMLIAQIVINLICMYNPERIVLDGGNESLKMIEIIRKECQHRLPFGVIPQMEAAQAGEYYFRGLGKLGRELLNYDIHVV